MPTPTIQNVSHGKINVRVFYSSNIFLCQEILSSELLFSIQHQKNYSWARTFGGLYNFIGFSI